MPYSDRERQREYQRERLAATRREWLAANGPCVKCGSWEQLEVDHKDPALKVDHKVWSWSGERRAVELGKCQVLCRECHTAKTITDHGRMTASTISQLAVVSARVAKAWYHNRDARGCFSRGRS